MHIDRIESLKGNNSNFKESERTNKEEWYYYFWKKTPQNQESMGKIAKVGLVYNLFGF